MVVAEFINVTGPKPRTVMLKPGICAQSIRLRTIVWWEEIGVTPIIDIFSGLGFFKSEI